MNSLTPGAPLKNETGLQYDSAEKANILNNFFSSVFVKNDGILPDFPRVLTQKYLITLSSILVLLKKL